jgi:hypothetical protein
MAAGKIGETTLCLMVLTSDEVSFATGFSPPIAGEDAEPLRALYRNASEKLPGKPSLMLSYVPLMNNFSPEFYVDTMSEISGGVPDFGTLAVDHNPDYHASQVLLNGESWTNRAAVLLLYGPVEPRFSIGTLSSKKIFSEKNTVTDAERNRLKTVNGVPVTDFLQSIGLTKNEDGTVAGMNSFPLVVDFGDGTPPVIRTMFALTPEGHAVCGGSFSVGAVISVGSFDEEEIVATTRHTLDTALEKGRSSVLLMYSCIGRYFAQGYNNTAEFEALLELLGETDAGYMAAYSSGEICPVYGNSGACFNRSHGNTFIVCAF